MPTRRLVLAVVAAALLVNAPARAAGDDVAVIVNKASTIVNLTMAQLRRILLGEESRWPSHAKILIWMTSPGQPDRTAALKAVCNMGETDFTLHFMHASFTGEGGEPPKSGGTAAQVRQLIAGAPEGIGLILASQADSSVKVLTIDGIAPGQPAYKIKLK